MFIVEKFNGSEWEEVSSHTNEADALTQIQIINGTLAEIETPIDKGVLEPVNRVPVILTMPDLEETNLRIKKDGE